MLEIKIIKLSSFLFLFLLFINYSLVKTQSKCPFSDSEDLFNYYVKGVVNNNFNISDLDYKDFRLELIHCINGYSTSPYIIRDNGEDFFKNSGIFIGSSIDLGKLSIDFIANNLYELSDETKYKLYLISGKFGEQAEEILNYIGDFTLNHYEISIINEKVYSLYSTEMKNKYFEPKKLKNYSLEMCLLTFFVKYYGLDSYLGEAKLYVDNEEYYILAYYFLNLKSNNYVQRKLWTLIALSSATIEYNYHHISFYISARVREESEQEHIKTWLKTFVSLNPNKLNLYSIGNYSKILLNKQNENIYNYTDLINIIDNYQFARMNFEDINDGIKKFEDILTVNNNLFNGDYYQRHLVIIFSSVHFSRRIELENFNRKGINVIALFKMTNLNDYNQMKRVYSDTFSMIPFYYYENLNKDNNMTFLLNSQINFYIENFFYNVENNIIEINGVKTRKKNNIHSFRINYKDLLENDNKYKLSNNSLFYYFHISFIFDEPDHIKDKFNGNANITFFVSNNNPYSDIFDYDFINFCFNTTVSSNYNKSPFINYNLSNKYINDDYFYITIIANELKYSLRIELLSETNYENFYVSNGLFTTLQVQPITSEYITTFSEDKCIQKLCNVNYISLVKYFSSGIHFNNRGENKDDFNKLFDLNMFECLYKNYYCPFFIIESKETVYNKGPYLGYGIDLPKLKQIELAKSFIPMYIINKIHPFLSNVFNTTLAKETLEKYNLILPYDQLIELNMYYFKEIFEQTKRITNFDTLSENIRMALFLRATELGTISGIKYIDDLVKGDIDTYLSELMSTEKTRTTTFESLNFQMLLIQATKINKLKKCLLSIVVGKSLLYSELFLELISIFSNYRVSVSYYDDKDKDTKLIQYFTEDISSIREEIYSITNNKTFYKKTGNPININSILKQQYSLFKHFDLGIKKSIIIVSTHSNETFAYNFTTPDKDLLEDLYESGINIFDYSDKINFINKKNDINEKNNEDNFYNSETIEYIQYVPYVNYYDLTNNYVTLYNIINKYPIPLNEINNIYLDLHPNEEIIFEFDLKNEKERLIRNDYLDKYNRLRFIFEPSTLDIYFSRSFPFPNIHSFEKNYSFEHDHKTKIFYDLKDTFEDQNNSKFYMSIKSPKKVDNLFVDLELCSHKGDCMKESFYFKFYLGFICVGALIFFYGIYICFCEITFKKESNIFDIK